MSAAVLLQRLLLLLPLSTRSRSPVDGRLEHICPVCGRGLGSSPDLRRCPHCGARALWRSGRTALDLSLVLFNARLCGIMAGIQAGLIALVAGGYRMPVPTWLVAVTALLPVAGLGVGRQDACKRDPHLA